MKIAVVIPARNEELLIGRAIQSLLQNGLSVGDIYVVDDGSVDRTGERAASYGVNLLNNPQNLGKAKSIKRTIEYFQLNENYDYLAFLDADSHLTSDYFKAIIGKLEEEPEAALVCGYVSSIPYNWLTAARSFEYLWGQLVYKRGQHKMKVILVSPGCATVIKASLVGELDLDGDTVTEDMDTTIQIHRKNMGNVIFAEKAVVYTQDPRNFADYCKQVHRWYFGMWQVMKKHRIPFGFQAIDLEMLLLVGEGLLMSLLYWLLLVMAPFNLSWLLLGDLTVTFFIALYFSYRTGRSDIVVYSPFFPFLKICNSIVLLITFTEVIILRKQSPDWFKPKRYLLALLILILPNYLEAESDNKIFFPGNTWMYSGNISPVERDNVTTYFHAEQGMTALRWRRYYLTPYFAVDGAFDTKGYDWDNRVAVRAGPKLMIFFPKGIIQAHFAYSHENRWKSSNSDGQPVYFLDYWFGWDQPRGRVLERSAPRFPGSTWGAVGVISPFEKDNLIGVADLTQGYNLLPLKNLSVIPFGKLQVSADSKNYNWNNKIITGCGIKFVFPKKSGMLEAGLQYLYEDRWKEGASSDVISVFGSYWFGWCWGCKGAR